MRRFREIDRRLVAFAALAVCTGVWALVDLAAISDGAERQGEGPFVPRLIASLLIATGLVQLVPGFGLAPRARVKPLKRSWRLTLSALIVALIVWPDVAVIADTIFPTPVTAPLRTLMLKLGPAEIFALLGLNAVLTIALGVVFAGRGLLSGFISLLIGVLLGLAGTDVTTGVTRLSALEALLDRFPVFTAPLVLGAIIAFLGVNPVPAVFGFLTGMAGEEQLHRVLLLSRGDLVLAFAARPITMTILFMAAVIGGIMVLYRWPVTTDPPNAQYSANKG